MDYLRLHPAMGFMLCSLPALACTAPLSEEHSLRLGLDQAEFSRLLEAREDAAQGQLLTSKTWVNPVLELSREAVGNETEINLWLYQDLDLSGRRRFKRDAAQAGLGVAEAHNQAQRIQRAAGIRRQFFQLLFQQRRQRLLTDWVEKFSAVETAVEQREAAGDVSGYDRRRISRERVQMLSLQRRSAARLEAAWQQLRGIIDPPNSRGFDTAEGRLLPAALPPLPAVLDGLAQQPALLRQQRQADVSRLQARAVARGSIPEIAIGVGVKRVSMPGASDSGLMLGIAMELPLFDRKQGAHQRANAEAIQAQSEYLLAQQRARGEARALWHEAEQLRVNAQLFADQSVAASHELVRIAETSYRGNEIGVLELIDAYRSALEAEISALDLALEARLVRIDLDEISTGVSP